MRTDEVFKSNSQSLSAKDLQGKRVTVEIAGYEVKKFDNASKPILSFVGKEKTLVLNKTNAFSIEMALGTNEMDQWIGQRITLRPDRTLFEGQMVACIRVDEVPPPPVTGKPVRKPVPPPVSDAFEDDDDASGVPF